MMKSRFIKLFSCCIPVKGSNRSIIIDTQRYTFFSIPNDLYEIIEKSDNIDSINLLSDCDDENSETLKEYFNFLIRNELAFTCDEKLLSSFPKIDQKWDYPGQISNAIIEFDSKSKHDIKNIINQLEKLGCINIEIRFYYHIGKNALIEFLKSFEKSRINSIDLVIRSELGINFSFLKDIISEYKRIHIIILTESNKNEVIMSNGSTMGHIIHTTQIMSNSKICGNVSQSLFSFQIDFINEARKYNTCLNRKISIDVNGEIKNCPSMNKSYGNICDTSISSVLKQKLFRELWKINKDLIKECKDCEFRYSCMDCRAFVEDSNDILSKPLKCNYQPNSNLQ